MPQIFEFLRKSFSTVLIYELLHGVSYKKAKQAACLNNCARGSKELGAYALIFIYYLFIGYVRDSNLDESLKALLPADLAKLL